MRIMPEGRCLSLAPTFSLQVGGPLTSALEATFPKGSTYVLGASSASNSCTDNLLRTATTESKTGMKAVPGKGERINNADHIGRSGLDQIKLYRRELTFLCNFFHSKHGVLFFPLIGVPVTELNTTVALLLQLCSIMIRIGDEDRAGNLRACVLCFAGISVAVGGL